MFRAMIISAMAGVTLAVAAPASAQYYGPGQVQFVPAPVPVQFGPVPAYPYAIPAPPVTPLAQPPLYFPPTYFYQAPVAQPSGWCDSPAMDGGYTYGY